MKKYLLLQILILNAAALHAQLLEKLKVNAGIHWVNTTWYKPLPGSEEPDKSKVPDIYMRLNTLKEYNKEGLLISAMDYQRGTDDVSGATKRYYRDGTKLKKEVMENDKYETIYTTIYTYNQSGNEIKRETTAGPADKFGITANEYTESVWINGTLTKKTQRDAKGALQSETTFTYDAKGLKIREDYYPVFLYAAKSFSYDAKGNVTNETEYDKEGKPYYVWTYEYNNAGRQLKQTLTGYTKGVKKSVEVTEKLYDPHGECTLQTSTKDGKLTSSYSWKHSYDIRGNRIQTVYLKDGKVEYIEVLKIMYY